MANAIHPHNRPARRQAGFSLVELMVSIVVGLVIIASLSMLFANNSRARTEMEKSAQQIENGRYATQYLRDDLRLAGYWGEFNPTQLSDPSSTQADPSVTDDASVMAAIPLAVQGYHFGKSGASNSTVPSGVTSLLTDLRPNTDILVVRRASTCVAGPASSDKETNCSTQDVTTSKYFQTSLCQTQLDSLNTTSQFVISTSAAVFTTTNPNVSSPKTFLLKKDCNTAATTRSVNVHIYYIANNDVSGDGIPTLKLLSLGSTAFGSPVSIAEGIETMQIEYGRDTSGDGIPDSWSNDPSSGLAAAAGVTAWRQVTAVKVHLVARNTQTSAGQFTDTRTYVLGSVGSTDNTFGPYNDGYKRHVYSTMVRLANVAGRLGD